MLAIDIELPTFEGSCPANISVELPNDADSVRVHWETPSAWDVVDGKVASVLTAGLPNGSYFGVGYTVVAYSATDVAANVVSETATWVGLFSSGFWDPTHVMV